MPITPKLSRKLYETFGDEAAADMVDWMQRVEAQRAELRELNEVNFSRFDARLGEFRHAMRAEFAAFREATQANVAELREELRIGLAQVDARMQAGFAGLEAKFERRVGDLMKWSFVFWVGAVAAIAALAGVLR